MPEPVLVRFGSLHGRLHVSDPRYLEALGVVFGVALHTLTPALDVTRQFELSVVETPDPEAADDVPDDRLNRLTLGGTATQPVIASEALRAELRLDVQPMEMRLVVLRPGMEFAALCVHFVVIVHKLLFACDRLILHAAAVDLGDGACLFVGDKGAGKSTTTLALARAGGTVLGEDQVALWRSPRGFLVSGNDERSRVTEQTEHHFFAEPLPIAPKDFAGTLKKELKMKDYFRSRPFQDFTPRRLVFPRVVGEFALRPLTSQQALRRMMAYNGHFQRFAGPRDQAAFLDFLAEFIGSVTCWELSLSEDLHDLDGLAERLRHA
jgi:hypothetical protein